MNKIEVAKEDILNNWSETEKEDALTAMYDTEFANNLIESGSDVVSTIMLDKSYQDAILEINRDGGFVN